MCTGGRGIRILLVLDPRHQGARVLDGDRIVRTHGDARADEAANHVQRRRLADVIGVWLERQAEHAHLPGSGPEIEERVEDLRKGRSRAVAR